MGPATPARHAEQLNIAIVCGGFPVLSETFVLDHVTAMLLRGHRVTIMPSGSTPEGGASHPDYVRHNLESHTIRPAPLPSARLIRHLARLGAATYGLLRHPRVATNALNFLRYGKDAISGHIYHTARQFGPGRQFDIIHAHFGWSGRPAQIMREIGAVKGPLITSFHGSDITVGYRPGKRMYGGLWRNGDRFTANSRFTAERMIADGCPQDKLSIWPMGASADFFKPCLRPESPELHLVGVGRLVPVKGWDIAIQALALTPPHCHLNIVGGGAEQAGLEALAANLGVHDRVHFHGPQPRHMVVDLMQRCQVFVLPGRVAPDGSTEAQGVVIAEAQATGLPAIVGNLGGMPDSIVDESTGFLTRPGDASDIAAKIMRLDANRDELASMSCRARLHAERTFSQERLYDSIEAMYRSFVANGRPSAAPHCTK